MVRRDGARARAMPDAAGVRWHRVAWWPPHRFFRFRRAGASVAAIADGRAPGRGHGALLQLRRRGHRRPPSRPRRARLLEVNSPVVDHPGSLKAALDAALVVAPAAALPRGAWCARRPRSWRRSRRSCPAFARAQTEIVTWGANVDAFSPERRREAAVAQALGMPDGAIAVLFSGSFRPWHGVHVLEDAARRLRRSRRPLLRARRRRRRGSGRRLSRAAGWAPCPTRRCRRWSPPATSASHPTTPRACAQLRLGFFWSPLKIFEYMASGLPTITVGPPAAGRDRARRRGRAARAGGGPGGAGARRSSGWPATRRSAARLGASARARAWSSATRGTAHCAQLEALLAARGRAPR